MFGGATAVDSRLAVWIATHRYAPRATPLFMAFAAAIAFARVDVGVHYPRDVIAGAAIGAAVGVLAAVLLRFARRHGRRADEQVTHPRTHVVARNG